jgi:malate synthase
VRGQFELRLADLPGERAARVLERDAIEFLAELHGRFGQRRLDLLAARDVRAQERRRTGALDFDEQTRAVREADWQVAAPRPDYADRRVEITGPTDRKLIINALNSGARGFMADFEDANAPSWVNQVEGQANLLDAVSATITYDSSDGRRYELGEQLATLLVRPRGWHLPERHVLAGGEPISGALTDFGLYVFHCGSRLLERGSAPYLYLPKLEHHLEARLWNDVLAFSEQALSLEPCSIRATVLIETLPAAFQMEEILFELRDRSYGLNAGRWDYMFSTIKTFSEDPGFVLPDRAAVTMTVPFMRSYAELLIRTCHRRGAFAMGGMAALIPSRTDSQANERAVAAVREDKEREASAGFDGTWVAHPDVVAVAQRAFDEILQGAPNQIARSREDVTVGPSELLDVAATPGVVTEAGLRGNLSVAFQYLSFWLAGRGAAAIEHLMEDAATAEIARSQVWQWIRHETKLDDGRTITRQLAVAMLDEETERIRREVGEAVWSKGRPQETRQVLEQVALGAELPEFMTLVAYELLV